MPDASTAVFRAGRVFQIRPAAVGSAGQAFLHTSIVILPNLNAGSGDRPH
jgi:hypothetical protein